MQSNLATKHFSPKFAIANGFVIGSLPQVLQWTTTNFEKKGEINEIEVTDILKVMVALVRTYACVFAYS